MKKLIAILTFCFPFLLRAQTNTSLNHWNATIHIGAFASGVPTYLKERMKLQGYKRDGGGLFSNNGSIPMIPQSPVFQLEIEKFINKSWSVKWLLSDLNGFVQGISSKNGILRIKYDITTSTILGGFHSKQRITRIAMGPALHFIKLEGEEPFNNFGHEPIKRNHTKIGFIVEAGLRFPKASLLFFDFNSQYHIVGKQDIGTYDFEEVDASGQPYTTTFTAGKKSFNYLAFNFGLGIRLNR